MLGTPPRVVRLSEVLSPTLTQRHRQAGRFHQQNLGIYRNACYRCSRRAYNVLYGLDASLDPQQVRLSADQSFWPHNFNVLGRDRWRHHRKTKEAVRDQQVATPAACPAATRDIERTPVVGNTVLELVQKQDDEVGLSSATGEDDTAPGPSSDTDVAERVTLAESLGSEEPPSSKVKKADPTSLKWGLKALHRIAVATLDYGVIRGLGRFAPPSWKSGTNHN
ncbi:unnamed protein product [Amoebophrya sp. A25]|nr:unnamed protein product [Amoebophrya sp. A25]|eukprot:GSA25T00023577001.1